MPTVCSMQNGFILTYSPFDLKTLSGSTLVWLPVKYLVCPSHLVCGSCDFSRLLAGFKPGPHVFFADGKVSSPRWAIFSQWWKYQLSYHFRRRKKKKKIIKVLLESKEQEGRASLASKHCLELQGPQKHLLSARGCRRNLKLQGITWCSLSGDKNCCIHSSILNTFWLLEWKFMLAECIMLFSCMSHFIHQLKICFCLWQTVWINFEICLCNEIACHAMDLSKVFIGRVSRQALRSALLF